MGHLFDNLTVGLALLSVLVIFVVGLLISVAGSFWPIESTNSEAFRYIATAVTGIVLTVASGALGVNPSAVTGVQPAKHPSASEASSAQAPDGALTTTIATAQVGAFKELYSATYIVLGIVCLIVLMVRRQPPDLIKTVGLTALTFLGLVVAKNLNNDAANLTVAVSPQPQLLQAPGR